MTLDEMNTLSEKIAELRKKYDDLDDQKKSAGKELEEHENQLLLALEASGLTQYRSPVGLFFTSHRTSVKTPKLPEDREAFFTYLKEQGDYDQLVTVNSMSLMSYYKAKLEAARDAGQDDFNMPGIKEVTITPILSFRKG